jgi:hypothetical protein
VLGRYRDWKRRGYIQMWNRARQFYDGPKWVRVTSDSDAPQYIQINEPGDPVQKLDPATGQVVTIPGPPKNHIAKMDVDIVLEDVPDSATLQQEQFNEFMAFSQANPGAIPPELLIELSAIPEKQKFLKKLRDIQAAQAPAKQQAQQLQMAEQQAKVAKTNAQAQESGAGAAETAGRYRPQAGADGAHRSSDRRTSHAGEHPRQRRRTIAARIHDWPQRPTRSTRSTAAGTASIRPAQDAFRLRRSAHTAVLDFGTGDGKVQPQRGCKADGTPLGTGEYRVI